MTQIIDDLRTVIDMYVGKEVFLISGSEDEDMSSLYIFEDWVGVIDQLKTMSPIIEMETRVFHGVLTRSEFLPNSFRRKSTFIIQLNLGDASEANVIESESEASWELANEIEDVIKTVNAISDIEIGIENIFILYGYKIETCLSINEDDVDEEIIETCKNIAAETIM
jgi:hypothetical protein